MIQKFSHFTLCAQDCMSIYRDFLSLIFCYFLLSGPCPASYLSSLAGHCSHFVFLASCCHLTSLTLGSCQPYCYQKSTFVTASPTIGSGLQRRTTVEVLSDAGFPLTSKLLTSLINEVAFGSPMKYNTLVGHLISHNYECDADIAHHSLLGAGTPLMQGDATESPLPLVAYATFRSGGVSLQYALLPLAFLPLVLLAVATQAFPLFLA